MGDIIDITYVRKDCYDRACSECGAGTFTWETFSNNEENHALVCTECGEYYVLYGHEKE